MLLRQQSFMRRMDEAQRTHQYKPESTHTQGLKTDLPRKSMLMGTGGCLLPILQITTNCRLGAFGLVVTTEGQQGEIMLVVMIFEVKMARKPSACEIILVPTTIGQLARHQILHPPI